MPVITSSGYRESRSFFFLLIFLALASYARVWTIRGVMWDDNAWLMSLYATGDLRSFLDTGFVEMRRIPQGIFLYFLYWLHKNTDLYFLAWHSLNMVTQIGTPLLLYAACLRLFNDQKLLAFLVAASLITITLDQTLPHAASINYRLGLLLGVASFYFTVLSIRSEHRLKLTILSVILAATAYTVFMEAIIALEPGRLVVIAYLMNQKFRVYGKKLIRKSLVQWSPYLVPSILFSIYRLWFRSYGAYADIYQMDFLFWINWQDNINFLAMLLQIQWMIFLDHIKEASVWVFAMGGITIISLIIFFRIQKKLFFASQLKTSSTDSRSVAWDGLFIGLTLMIPALLIFQFLGRPVTWGLHSSHGTIGQFGYAMVVGSLLFLSLHKLNKIRPRWTIYYLSGVSVLFAAGVFFNNLNIDLYRNSHKQVSEFWIAFIQRFPSLPASSTVLLDVKLESFYLPRYHGAYEFPLNLLYAEKRDPERFRNHLVVLPNEIEQVLKANASALQLRTVRILRPSPWGGDVMEPEKLIVVYYDKSGLYINKEISNKFPSTPYRAILDKDLPELSNDKRNYPFRSKMFIKY